MRSEEQLGATGAHLKRRSLLIGAVLSAAFLFSACLSPTLPLPPPSAPFVSAPDNSGLVRVRGTVTSFATVHIMNNRTSKGVSQLTEDGGAYDLQLQAEVGDILSVREKVGTQESASKEVSVPEEDPITDIPPLPKGLGGAAP